METAIVEQALTQIVKYAIKRGEALEEGKSQIANRCYDKIRRIVDSLKEENQLSLLAKLYDHSNSWVCLTASVYLLPLYEKESLSNLRRIAKMDGLCAFEAEMTIKEWKNGNLKNFYTAQ